MHIYWSCSERLLVPGGVFINLNLSNICDPQTQRDEWKDPFKVTKPGKAGVFVIRLFSTSFFLQLWWCIMRLKNHCNSFFFFFSLSNLLQRKDVRKKQKSICKIFVLIHKASIKSLSVLTFSPAHLWFLIPLTAIYAVLLKWHKLKLSVK